MATQVSYSYARDNLAEVLETAEDTREAVILRRRNHEDIALIPTAELRSLEETAHLLRSPRNAQRLLAALQRALQSSMAPQSVAELRRDLRLE